MGLREGDGHRRLGDLKNTGEGRPPEGEEERVARGWDRGQRPCGLLNAGLPLQPANILDDLANLLGCDSLDGRHVPKVPMVGSDAVRSRAIKGGIPVMARFVNLVD